MFPVKNMGSQKLISDRQQMEDILSNLTLTDSAN
jgi:hypothetical protein